MRNSSRSLLAAGLVTAGLALVPMAGQSVAQGTGDASPAGSARTNTTGTMNDARPVDRTDNDTNYGWLGLLGLAGLAGLMPRKAHPVAVATTHRTNDGVNR